MTSLTEHDPTFAAVIGRLRAYLDHRPPLDYVTLRREQARAYAQRDFCTLRVISEKLARDRRPR